MKILQEQLLLRDGTDPVPDRKALSFAYQSKEGKQLTPYKYLLAKPFSEGLALVINGEQWQFINTDFEEVIILSEYIFASDFSCGLALVRAINGKYGYINKLGKEVIAPRFDDATSFREAQAQVLEDFEWKSINTKGELLENEINTK